MMMKGKILKAWIKRSCRKMINNNNNGDLANSSVECEGCCWQWALMRCCWASSSSFMQEEKKISVCNNIPKDVPKGHLVVYVGEKQRRFVIKVKLLKHPLFGALLDEAREEYGFSTADSRFYIPCNEDTFLAVVRCAMTPRHPNPRMLLWFS